MTRNTFDQAVNGVVDILLLRDILFGTRCWNNCTQEGRKEERNEPPESNRENKYGLFRSNNFDLAFRISGEVSFSPSLANNQLQSCIHTFTAAC